MVFDPTVFDVGAANPAPEAALVRDALGDKIIAVTGVKAVYGNGSTAGTSVRPWPKDIVETPVALVARGTKVRDAYMGSEVNHRSFDVHFYLSRLDEGAAQRWVDAIDDALDVEFRTGIQGSEWVQCLYAGAEPIDEVTLNDKPFLRWTAHFEVITKTAVLFT